VRLSGVELALNKALGGYIIKAFQARDLAIEALREVGAEDAEAVVDGYIRKLSDAWLAQERYGNESQAEAAKIAARKDGAVVIDARDL